jgi:hypothetical protein
MERSSTHREKRHRISTLTPLSARASAWPDRRFHPPALNPTARTTRARTSFTPVNLSDLLNDARNACDTAGDFRVLIATRTVDGVELEPGRVQVREAGEARIDPSGGEVDLLPVEFMDEPGRCLTVAAVQHLVSGKPEAAEFVLTGATGMIALPDGSTALRTAQALGTYVLADRSEIWLLLYPEQQWPRDWFGT